MPTALVTGASGGVGRAVAVALGARGDDVWLVGRRKHALGEVAAAVESNGGHAHVHVTDLVVDDDIDALSKDIARSTDQLHTVVHCAGVIVAPQRVSDLDARAIDEQFRVNVRAPALLTRAILPLVTAAHGDIVFMNSTAATHGVASSSAYAASKAALRSFADSLRDELGDRDVRVLTVLLGRTATPMQEALHRAEAKRYDEDALIQADDVAALVLSAIALPRTAEVTEVSVRPARRPTQ